MLLIYCSSLDWKEEWFIYPAISVYTETTHIPDRSVWNDGILIIQCITL